VVSDITLAEKNAKYCQPEFVIGTIPGAGGIQHLIHSIGKFEAMEIFDEILPKHITEK
jgi:enoyl-CoA hydratase